MLRNSMKKNRRGEVRARAYSDEPREGPGKNWEELGEKMAFEVMSEGVEGVTLASLRRGEAYAKALRREHHEVDNKRTRKGQLKGLDRS